MQCKTIPRPWTFWLLVVQCVLLAITPLLIVAYRLEFLRLNLGFLGVAALIMTVAILGVFALLVWIFATMFKRAHLKPGSGWATILALFPLAISLSIVGGGGFSMAPIHDISTDTQNPPLFLSAVIERKQTDNSLEYNFKSLPAQQQKAYPDIAPLTLTLSPEAAFAKAHKLIEDNGWTLTGESHKNGHLEAVYQSLIFAFKDDIVIRIRPASGGSIIDMRSSSRVGISDLGANAKRIRTFLQALAR